jgi:hypothetical protein
MGLLIKWDESSVILCKESSVFLKYGFRRLGEQQDATSVMGFQKFIQSNSMPSWIYVWDDLRRSPYPILVQDFDMGKRVLTLLFWVRNSNLPGWVIRYQLFVFLGFFCSSNQLLFKATSGSIDFPWIIKKHQRYTSDHLLSERCSKGKSANFKIPKVKG